MKKLFVAVALVMGLGTSVAFAENFHASVDSVNIVNEFKPIEVKDLPQAVLDAVTKDYAEFTIKEAYVEEVEGTKTYKVVLTDAEDNTGQRNNLRGKSDKFISLPERKSAKVMETSGYRLLLPEGTLDYFIISDVKESSTEIVIYLEEKNEVPGEYSSMQVESKGFYEPVVVQDFPIRGKKLFLNIRRRRWIVKDEGRYVSRNWKLVAEGSRITHDFASFLKELY